MMIVSVDALTRSSIPQTASQTRPLNIFRFLFLNGPITVDDDELSSGTTSGWILREPTAEVELVPTTSGADPEDRFASRFVHELRRRSGLTWEHLAKLFGVTRRAVHLWASGKPMTLAHETKLHRLLAVLCKADRGEARLNRAALLSVGEDGASALELLSRSHYVEAAALMGRAPRFGARNLLVPLSKDAAEARRPPRVAELLDAEQDVIHRREGRLVRKRSRLLKPS